MEAVRRFSGQLADGGCVMIRAEAQGLLRQRGKEPGGEKLNMILGLFCSEM